MLVLSALHSLLSQVLHAPDLHTAILFSPAGHLVSVATDQYRSRDDIHIVVGLSGEVWQETREQGYGMVDSELGRILVLPVEEPADDASQDGHQPLMLLALNSTDVISWEELQSRGSVLTSHLAKALGKFREHLTVKTLPPANIISPPPTSAPILRV